ncbi:hypothetical protein K2W90_02230 [Candidatus Babeliales bacterium]|nr:hypothetical protein [Candidatus Babeliales bacterium]
MKKNSLFFAALVAVFSASNCMAAKITQALVLDCDTETGQVQVLSIEEKIEQLKRDLQEQGVDVQDLLNDMREDVDQEEQEARNDGANWSNKQKMLHHVLKMLYHGLSLGKATIFFVVNDVVVPYVPRIGTSLKQMSFDLLEKAQQKSSVLYAQAQNKWAIMKNNLSNSVTTEVGSCA